MYCAASVQAMDEHLALVRINVKWTCPPSAILGTLKIAYMLKLSSIFSLILIN